MITMRRKREEQVVGHDDDDDENKEKKRRRRRRRKQKPKTVNRRYTLATMGFHCLLYFGWDAALTVIVLVSRASPFGTSDVFGQRSAAPLLPPLTPLSKRLAVSDIQARQQVQSTLVWKPEGPGHAVWFPGLHNCYILQKHWSEALQEVQWQNCVVSFTLHSVRARHRVSLSRCLSNWTWK